jgi:proline iminopeptidase
MEAVPLADGVQFVPIVGTYKVWTRRVGSGPAKMLLLHGGPGASHEYLECFEERMPLDEVEVIFYDQLGSYLSDQPDDPSSRTRSTSKGSSSRT